VSEWDEYAADWDTSAAVRQYADQAFESLTRLAEAVDFTLSGARACDFGCGTGLLTERLADRCTRIDAVDTSSAMREVLEEKIDRQRWTHARVLDRLPPTRQGYDLMVCSSVLSFVDDYPEMVGTLVSHLAAGGLFVQWDWESSGDNDGHGFTRSEIQQTLEGAGLDPVAVDTGFEVTVDGEVMRPLMGWGRRAF